MTVRRWVDAFIACILISLLLMRRLETKDSFLFGGAVFIIYLTGYLAVQHIGRQKYTRAEAHAINFAIGMAITSIGWYAALLLSLPINAVTFAIVEALISFVLINIIWLRRLKNAG
ncbi:MAG: hypothetical protein QW165_01110 [Candidatus Woesearchaeota archaeon]